MTVKELVGKMEGFEFIEEMRDNGYEDLYQECTSILNSVKSVDEETESKLLEIKEKYETQLHQLIIGEHETVEYQHNIELNVRSFNRMLSKFPVKEFTLTSEVYSLGSLKFRKEINDNGDYLYSIIKENFDGYMDISEEEYNSINFTGDLDVKYEASETLRISDECVAVRNIIDDEVQVYVKSSNGKFPKIIGKCALSDIVKELFAEKKEKKENKEKKEKKTAEVKAVVKKTSKKGKVAEVSNDDMAALDELDI